MTVRNVTAVDPGAEGVVNGHFDGPGFSSMRSTASRLHVGDLEEVFVQTVSSGDDVYGVPMGAGRYRNPTSQRNASTEGQEMSATTDPPYGPKPWYVAGMASYLDAATIVSSGNALVMYQKSLGLTGDQCGWRRTPDGYIVDVLLPDGVTADLVLPDGITETVPARRHTFTSGDWRFPNRREVEL